MVSQALNINSKIIAFAIADYNWDFKLLFNKLKIKIII